MASKAPAVKIVRKIKASPAKIFAALTEPAQMLQWWGPDAGPTLKVDADVRPGGRFSIVFRLLSGEEANPTGVYWEVIPDRKLVFTWELPGTPEDQTVVTFLLEPYDGGTQLTLTHEGLPGEPERKSHEDGWKGFLEKLPVYLGVAA